MMASEYTSSHLRIHPNEVAPTGCRIMDRVATRYILQDTSSGRYISTSIEAVTRYVSELELEEFETERFDIEGERLKEREKQSESEDECSTEESSTYSSSPEPAQAPVAIGRHGRARPSYAQMFLPPDEAERSNQAKKRRKLENPRISPKQEMPIRSNPGNRVMLSAEQQDQIGINQARQLVLDQKPACQTAVHQATQTWSSSETESLVSMNQVAQNVLPVEQKIFNNTIQATQNMFDTIPENSTSTEQAIPTIDSESDGDVVVVERHTADPEPDGEVIVVRRCTELKAPLPLPVLPSMPVMSNTPPPVLPAVSMMRYNADDHIEGGDSDDEESDEEDLVETIIGHGLSDPRYHPELGNTPIMLFHVKWVGSETTTWEPRDSFNEELIRNYEERVGLRVIELD